VVTDSSNVGVLLKKGSIPNGFRFELKVARVIGVKGMICWSVIGRTQSAQIRIDERLVVVLVSE
jgi:hypothetical protein